MGKYFSRFQLSAAANMGCWASAPSSPVIHAPRTDMKRPPESKETRKGMESKIAPTERPSSTTSSW